MVGPIWPVAYLHHLTCTSYVAAGMGRLTNYDQSISIQSYLPVRTAVAVLSWPKKIAAMHVCAVLRVLPTLGSGLNPKSVLFAAGHEASSLQSVVPKGAAFTGQTAHACGVYAMDASHGLASIRTAAAGLAQNVLQHRLSDSSTQTHVDTPTADPTGVPENPNSRGLVQSKPLNSALRRRPSSSSGNTLGVRRDKHTIQKSKMVTFAILNEEFILPILPPVDQEAAVPEVDIRPDDNDESGGDSDTDSWDLAFGESARTWEADSSFGSLANNQQPPAAGIAPAQPTTIEVEGDCAALPSSQGNFTEAREPRQADAPAAGFASTQP